MNSIKSIDNCFEPIIGHANAVYQMKQSAYAYANGGEPVNFLLLAEAGQGKTRLGKAYFGALREAAQYRKRHLNSRWYSSPEKFRLEGEEFDALKEAFRLSRDIAVAFDEISDFGKKPTRQLDKVYSLIKELLDGNGWSNGEKVIKFDNDPENEFTFKKGEFCILGATNHPEKMPDKDAIRSRFQSLTLGLFNLEETTKILMGMLEENGIHANENTIGLISRCSRGGGRILERMTDHFKTMLASVNKKTRTINRDEVLAAMKVLELYPQGLTKNEVFLLEKCAQRTYTSASLSMATALERGAIRTSLAFLESKRFINLKGTQVTTSKEGKFFLDELRKEKFVIPVAK